MQNGSVVPRFVALARPCLFAVVGLSLMSCEQEPTAPLAGDEMNLGVGGVKKTTTAQSVMIELVGPSDFVIEETTIYSYDWSGQPAALAVFDAYFTLSTSGGPTSAQRNSTMHEALKDNKCNFWGGSMLQPVTRTFGGGRSATATPRSPGMYAAKTGWSYEANGGGPVYVSLDDESFIASESAVNKTGGAGWTRKYSFSLDETRIQGFDIQLLDGAYNVIAPTSGTGGIASFSPGHDFDYAGNAGSNGAVGLLAEGWVNQILGGSTGDNFAGNDGEGAVKAFLNPMMWTLSEGNYTLKATGTVKGVDGAANTKFNGTKQVTILGGC